jgi:methylglutaconyl-CoA hydratase
MTLEQRSGSVPDMTPPTTLRLATDDRGVATLTLDRPEVRNAFDAAMIAELTEAATGLAADDAVRVVVLAADGDTVFSAGADLNWMGSMRDWTVEQNVADATRMDAMFRALWDLPKPLIGRINGHALGGGTGLTAVCDIAIAAEEATFGFTEVLLGIVPAVISPYAVRKVGRSFARSVFVTGERFSAARALQAGLVHEVVGRAELDAAVAAAVARCLKAAPVAAGVAKSLPELALAPLDEATSRTVEVIAALRVADEGQAGMAAFLDKRSPPWVPAAGG